MSYKRILVAVDTTDEAEEVLGAARSVADEQQARLYSVTAVKPLAHVYGGLDMAPIAQADVSFEKAAMKHAEQYLTQVSKKYKIGVNDVKVCLGSPAYEIRSFAEEIDADLIVIGTHGKHGLRLLLGSVANAVLHGVPCDVLAVKIQPAEKD